MEFGLQISSMEPQKFRDVAQSAEGLGFDVLFLPDHIVGESIEKQLDPRTLCYDPIAMAAVLADATKKIRIGHLVLCNLFRHPAIAAQSLTTLDHVSNGRLIAGFGTGWTETEFQMTGLPFPPIAERLRMLDESLNVICSLWGNERTTFKGEFYNLTDAISWPKPLQKPHPPILIGGGGKGVLRIAAKYADVLNINQESGKPGKISLASIKRLNDSTFIEKVNFVREEAKKYNRKPDAIRISSIMFIVSICSSREATRKIAAQMAPVLGLSPDELLRAPMALIGTPEECVTELQRRAQEWGVNQFIFSGGVGTDVKQLRRIKEEIVANVKISRYAA